MRSSGPTNSARQHHRIALALTVLAGALLAVQARINGALSTRLGSAVVTAGVSFAVGTALLLLLVVARGSWRPAWSAMRANPVPWWYCIGGLGGATLVAVSAAAVPLIGVALLTVFIVAGQTSGGLLVDRLGLGPGGRHPLSVARVAGSALAVGALALGAYGRPAGSRGSMLLVAGIVVAGLLVAGQQAVNGRLQEVTGQAPVAALVSFVGGTLVLGGLLMVQAVTGYLPTLHWPGMWWLYVGGGGGALYILLSAATVRMLGVLRLTLASIAGQLLGAVLLDASMPSGQPLRLSTIGAVAAAFLAVAVAGRRGAVRPTSPPGAGRPGTC